MSKSKKYEGYFSEKNDKMPIPKNQKCNFVCLKLSMKTFYIFHKLHLFFKIIGLVCITLMMNFGYAQVNTDTITLKEVVLTNANVIAPYFEKSASVSVLTKQQLEKVSGAMLTPLLNQIPGVQMQQGNWNTNRITIRGIGSRTPFGTTKIKSYWNDIPMTSAEGETVIEDIDMNLLHQVQILKGPNAVNYGAGMGGVIVLQSKIPNTNHRNWNIHQEVGDFGLWRNSISFQEKKGTTGIQLGYQHQSINGFRENSNYRRDQWSLLAEQKISDKHNIQIQGLFTDVRAYIPSSINLNDATNQPHVAAANWRAAKGFEDYQKNVLGITHQYFIDSYWLSKLTLFHQSKKAYEPRPFDILSEIQSSYGWRYVLQYFGNIKNIPLQVQLGWEHQKEDYQFDLFRNLYTQFPEQGSVQGNWFQNGKQNRSYHHWFVQTTIELSDKWNVNADAAYHISNYNLTQGSITSAHSFRPFFAPRIAFTYLWKEHQMLFASFSKGFSTPTVAESLTVYGIFNTNLKPEIAENWEIGYKWKHSESKWIVQINYYYMPVSNLLVAKRIAEDQYEGRNAGESLHQGLEWETQWKKTLLNREITFQYSGNWNRMRFTDFIDANQNYSGNLLPAVPSWQHSINIGVKIIQNLQLHSNYRFMASMPLNDRNDAFTNSFGLIDIYANYKLTPTKYWKSFQLFLGINNLTNRNYTASIVPNAIGINQNAPRFFYPGMPKQFFGGIRIQL